jgi:hypothetical protein
MWPSLSQLKQVKVVLVSVNWHGSVHGVLLLACTNGLYGPWAVIVGLGVTIVMGAGLALVMTCALVGCLSWNCL